ncbi:MAG TPA: hypothetical protein VF737_09935 [Gemmatimonadaceae bacterium]
MRTTVDLPDDLYRRLKARAALGGLKVRELMTQYVEQGLRSLPTPSSERARSQPPVAVPPTGKRIRALTRSQLRRIEEDEEIAGRARPRRR